MRKNNIKTIIIIVLGIVILYLLYLHFSAPKNIIITDIGKIPTQNTNQIFINDSVKGAYQNVLILQDKKTISELQSKNQKLLSELVRLKPELAVSYTENMEQGEVIGELQDSLSSSIDDLIAAKTNLSISKDSFEMFRLELLSKRIPFTITDNKWRFEKGSFTLGGNIKSDSLKIVSKPSLTFGEKGGFLKRKQLSVIVSNENPFMKQDSLKTFYYKSKDKIKPSISAIGLSDGKSITIGAGLNLRKGPISVTLGYTLLHKQF